ncbi:uncharacterized protein [Haliotis cracherodii]|uniref:uncharacterized protein n=1 Tax=Haliotis cracherodii TaxID=6455 RepID=UPI0039ED1EE2
MHTLRSTCVLISIITATLQPTHGLQKGRQSQLDFLCNEYNKYTVLPWDCTGYVQCSTDGVRWFAHWMECANHLYWSQTEKTCTMDASECGNPLDVASKACPTYSSVTFPHPESCAKFFDCSEVDPPYGLRRYENECPYPQLYDVREERCKPPDQVYCGKNPRPRSKCDYAKECGPCEGRPDGVMAVPDQPFSKNYIYCHLNKTYSPFKCPGGSQVFDPLTMKCSSVYKASIATYCTQNPTAMFTDAANCAKYYDCRKRVHYIQFDMYESECPYNQLYDAITGTCKPYNQVDCGHRWEPKSPCEYKVGHCLSNGASCIPCDADCKQQADGFQDYTATAEQGDYLECREGRTISIRHCPAGYTFSYNDCVDRAGKTSEYNPTYISDPSPLYNHWDAPSSHQGVADKGPVGTLVAQKDGTFSYMNDHTSSTGTTVDSGTPTGGIDTSGTPTGGTDTSGTPTGGTGTPTGGTDTSGTPTGGTGTPTGGTDTSGKPTGGTGTPTGGTGTPTGGTGTPTGGTDTSGTPTGGTGTPTGGTGTPTGGTGTPSGGTDTSGTPTGGTGTPTGGTDISGTPTGGTGTPTGGTDTSGTPTGGTGTPTGGTGTPSGGTDTSGTPTGGTDTSGTPTGGTDTSGTPAGGTDTSGTPTGGTDTSGTSTGGTGTPTGGTDTSGTPTGGTDTSGTPTGGTDTSGTPTGGTDTSGTPTGGTGTPTGGTDTSGTSTGGTDTSGTPAGGTGTPTGGTDISGTPTGGTDTSGTSTGGTDTSGTTTASDASTSTTISTSTNAPTATPTITTTTATSPVETTTTTITTPTTPTTTTTATTTTTSTTTTTTTTPTPTTSPTTTPPTTTPTQTTTTTTKESTTVTTPTTSTQSTSTTVATTTQPTTTPTTTQPTPCTTAAAPEPVIQYYCNCTDEVDGALDKILVLEDFMAEQKQINTLAALECKNPPTLARASTVLQHKHFGSEAIYTCDAGFSFCGSRAVSMCPGNGTWEQIDGACVQSVWNYPRVMFRQNFLCPFAEGTVITVYGTPTRFRKSMIDLISGTDKALLITICFQCGTTRTKVTFSAEEGGVGKNSIAWAYFPFEVGKEFKIVISVTQRAYKIEIEDKPAFHFEHVLPVPTVDALVIADEITIRKVTIKPSNSLQSYMPELSLGVVPHQSIEVKDASFITFKVKSCGNIHFKLATADSVTSQSYLVYLGEDGNTMSTIRKCQACANMTVTWHQPLKCTKFTPFWASWGGGNIKIGAGYIPGANAFLETSDSEYPINYFLTGQTDSSAAEWIFTTPIHKCGLPPPMTDTDLYVRENGLVGEAVYTCHLMFTFCGESHISTCTEAGTWEGLKGECLLATWHRRPMPASMPFPCSFGLGSVFSVYGRPLRPTKFSISLRSGADTLLIVTVGFNLGGMTNTVIYNANLDQIWGTQDESILFPFQLMREFHLTITVEQNYFKVAVDGTPIHNFVHRSPFAAINSAYINDDIMIRKIQVYPSEVAAVNCQPPTPLANGNIYTVDTSVGTEVKHTCNNDFFFCGVGHTIICDNTGKWEGLDGFCTLGSWNNIGPVPNMGFVQQFPCRYQEGLQVRVTGKPLLDPTTGPYFSLQLRDGSEVPLGIDVYKTELKMNSMIPTPGKEETVSIQPIAVGTPVDFAIMMTEYEFVIYSGYDELYRYNHRTPVARAHEIIILPNLDVTQIQFTVES